jgi:hypothetical protein
MVLDKSHQSIACEVLYCTHLKCCWGWHLLHFQDKQGLVKFTLSNNVIFIYIGKIYILGRCLKLEDRNLCSFYQLKIEGMLCSYSITCSMSNMARAMRAISAAWTLACDWTILWRQARSCASSTHRRTDHWLEYWGLIHLCNINISVMKSLRACGRLLTNFSTWSWGRGCCRIISAHVNSRSSKSRSTPDISSSLTWPAPVPGT